MWTETVKPAEQGPRVTARSLRGEPPEPPGSNQPCPDLRPEQGVRALLLLLSCLVRAGLQRPGNTDHVEKGRPPG